MKPRVVLDKQILNGMNDFYSSKISDKCLNNECFSHPDLESHICNVKALLDGGGQCDYCKHIVGRRCNITCHVHHFCMAVFAYRLGIGGDNLWKAIKHNTTKLSFNKLQQMVFESLGMRNKDEPNEEGEAQDINRLEISSAIIDKPTEDDAYETPQCDEEQTSSSDDLITVGEAAKLYGCSYFNMYSHIKRGNLKKIIKGDAHFVSKADVIAMKENKDKITEKLNNRVGEENSDVIVELSCACGKKMKSKSGLTLHQKSCEVHRSQINNN